MTIDRCVKDQYLHSINVSLRRWQHTTIIKLNQILHLVRVEIINDLNSISDITLYVIQHYFKQIESVQT